MDARLNDGWAELVDIGPQPGPQTAFAQCTADIAIFGGAAGGGKSNALLYEAVKHTANPAVIGYRAIIFRRSVPELIGGGGLVDEARALYTAFGGTERRGNHRDWTFEASTRKVEHRHMVKFEHMQDMSACYSHQGLQYAFIGFDELTHFTEQMFWYMSTRLRSISGVRPYIRGTCNPDPSSFVKQLIAWWLDEDTGWSIPERSGVIRWIVRRGDEVLQFATEDEAKRHCYSGVKPLSLTFIASKLSDNRILLDKDPDYASRIAITGGAQAAALLGAGVAGFTDGVDRGGNWNEQKGGGALFDQDDVVISDEPPSPLMYAVRAWDQAASEPTTANPNPDWTRGVKVWRCQGGEYWIEDVASMRLYAGKLFASMRAVAERDGPQTQIAIWQDSAGAGKLVADTTRDQAFAGFRVEIHQSGSPYRAKLIDMSGAKSSNNKVAWAESIVVDAKGRKIFSRRAEWTGTLLQELHHFPRASKDDCVDALVLAIHQLRSMDRKQISDPGRTIGRETTARRVGGVM